MRYILYSLVVLAGLLFNSCSSDPATISSPDGQIQFILESVMAEAGDIQDEQVQYRIFYGGKEVIGNSQVGLEFRNSPDLARGLEILNTETRQVDKTWERVWGRSKIVRDQYNELTVHLADESKGVKLDLIIRAYDDGIAFLLRSAEAAPRAECRSL